MHSLVAELESHLMVDRASTFCGTALIKFVHLDFRQNPNKAKTNRLKKIFRRQGCFQFEPLHRIRAIIAKVDLDHAIVVSGTTSKDLFTNPEGKPPLLAFSQGFRVPCLKGASRIAAAKDFLHSQDHHWAVDLFSTGNSNSFQVPFRD